MKHLRNKIKNQKGITLIALIITIIVLLILAGVVINMTLGNDGIISKAQSSADMYNKAAALETMNLKVSEVQMKFYSEKQRGATLQEMANYLTEDEMVEYVKLGKPTASIDVTGYSSILVKLKAYVYEFEIGKGMQVAIVGEGSGGAGGGTGTPITSQITEANVASHIGEYVDLGTNLITKTGTTHNADWRIFDADSTGVYVILADYLPNTTIEFPDTMKVSEGGKQVTINKNANGWTIGWLNSGDGACANNTEAVGTLLTASNWDFLAPSSKFNGKITGGPTYEQFARSWNKVNSSVQEMDPTTPTKYSDLTDSTGVYIITDTKSSTVLGNWLASSYSVNTNNVWEVDFDTCGVNTLMFYYAGFYGVRPVVHLTSDINVDGQDEKGVWQLAQ